MDNKAIVDFEENDELNIEAIIEAYNSYIYTIIKNSITYKEDIEEILSDVFVIFWKNYNNLDKQMKVKPYLIGITKNLIKKKYRNVSINNNFENIENYENKISNYIDIEVLAENNEKSKIISKEYNISISKTKIILHRLRKKLKKKLKERGYDYGK